MGGLLNGSAPSSELTSLLSQNNSAYTWVAATVGSNNAAGYQLATGAPVMAIGGFNGTDPTPTLHQFQQYVGQGKIHYFIAGEMMGGRDSAGSDYAQQISSWVEEDFTPTTVGGASIYDLTPQTN
jgi:4-amino-4-deoxy-L-arabinose transferase-like glycosyltransferase